MIRLDKVAHTKHARKVLVSGGQDIQAILSAVNEGRLDYCLTKPLQDNVLRKTALQELTSFVLEHDKDNILSYSTVLISSVCYARTSIIKCAATVKDSSRIITAYPIVN